jgi:hypothetical protein
MRILPTFTALLKVLVVSIPHIFLTLYSDTYFNYYTFSVPPPPQDCNLKI